MKNRLRKELVFPGRAGGAALPQAANRLAMFVTNITQDKKPRDPSSAPHFGDRFASSQPVINLNIFLMLAANYDAENYLEALKVLLYQYSLRLSKRPPG